MYDILCVTHSKIGKNLFKTYCYNANKNYQIEKEISKHNHLQLSLDFGDNQDFEKSSNDRILFYDAKYYSKLIIDQFEGQNIEYSIFKDFILEHDIIPYDGAISDIKKRLKLKGIIIKRNYIDFGGVISE